MSLIFVKTASGCRRRDPFSWKILPSIDDADSKPVEIDDADPHWFRALQCGDIVETDADGALKTAPAAMPATAAPAAPVAAPAAPPAVAAPAATATPIAPASPPAAAAAAAPVVTKSA